MTTLIAWAAIDQRTTSSVYMASDSRLTWDKHGTWDSGRKIFASEKFPEILGYTGDALFCSQILSQVIAFIDACSVLETATNFEAKFALVESLIVRAFSTYPTKFCLPKFSIIYLTRIGNGLEARWGGCTLAWSMQGGWQPRSVHHIPHTWDEVWSMGINSEKEVQDRELAHQQAVIFVSAGSGGKKFRTFYNGSEWSKKLPLISRGIFGAFSDFVEHNGSLDPATGGTPQLSALYRASHAQKIGFVKDNNRHLYGIILTPDEYDSRVRWVNSNFENCGSFTGKLIAGQQRQPAPY